MQGQQAQIVQFQYIHIYAHTSFAVPLIKMLESVFHTHKVNLNSLYGLTEKKVALREKKYSHELSIILEEESGGLPMFSADMLSNIIRYYGHSMQGLMGNYLERSIGAFHEAQKKFQEQTKSLYGNIGAGAGPTNQIPPFGSDALAKLMQAAPGVVPNLMGDYLEKSASNVVGMQEELRKKAMQMFSTFPYNPLAPDAATASNDVSADKPASESTTPSRAKKPGSKPKNNTRRLS